MGRPPAPIHADFQTHIDDDTVFVATAGGDITGYVILCNIDDEWWLDNIATSPNHQGLGIGRLLVIVAEGWLAHRTDHVHLYTNTAMSKNIVLYQRLGYKWTGRRTVDGFDRVYFTKQLDKQVGVQP
jgi:GNAT superfamily N-acetyltransferase